MATAYLMVRLEFIGHDPIPKVTAVLISSQAANQMSAGIWATLFEVSSLNGFAEAEKRLLEYMDRIPYFKPFKLWLADGKDAHLARFGLYLANDAQRDVLLEDNSAYQYLGKNGIE